MTILLTLTEERYGCNGTLISNEKGVSLAIFAMESFGEAV